MPKDVPWQGRTVFTGVFKEPVAGRRRVARLNIEGDGQGDLAGHGGEQRAVFVYQIDSYRYWEHELGRDDFVYGQFGENFTVEGLADEEVCIGDRYRIGTASFEVTQPRVTCYRVGIRMNDPRIPALLVSHRRPGFYFRVLEEGEVQAGDGIVKLASGPEQMPVAEVDALLYLPGHGRQDLLRALRIPALSPGWQASFRALLDQEPGSGNVGLAASSPPPAWPGFRPLRVTAVTHESDSRDLDTARDPRRCPAATGPPGSVPDAAGPPGRAAAAAAAQLFAVRSAGGALTTGSASSARVAAPRAATCTRASPSATSSTSRRRAAASSSTGARHRCCWPAPGSAPPRSSPCSKRWRRTVPIGRSGGCTGLATATSTPSPPRSRPCLPPSPTRAATSTTVAPAQTDVQGRDYDATGHLTGSVLAQLQPPLDAQAYVCGPAPFMDEISAGLSSLGIEASHIHTEPFGPAPGVTPGIAAKPERAPHPPAGPAGEGPTIEFARSDLAIPWSEGCGNLLQLAEACDVPVRWSCRTGVCQTCETTLIAGEVTYSPDPVEPPPEGSVLICCSRPRDNIVLDL